MNDFSENQDKASSHKTVCLSCGNEIAMWAVFCPYCGKPVKKFCQSCGASVSGSDRFCLGCGADLWADDTPPAAPDGKLEVPAGSSKSVYAKRGEKKKGIIIFVCIFIFILIMAAAAAVIGFKTLMSFSDAETEENYSEYNTGKDGEKAYYNAAGGYEMKYDADVWELSEENKRLASDYGSFTYSAVFKTKDKVKGESAASFKILKEDLSEFSYSRGSVIDDIADSLALRLADGTVSFQKVEISGKDGYRITVLPSEEMDYVMDIVFFISDDSVYEFYYTAVDEENYELYENGSKGVNYMLNSFSVN